MEESTTLDQFIKAFGPPVHHNSYSGEYKFVCPVCRYKALNANIVSGLFRCTRCGEVRGKKGGATPISHRPEPVDLECLVRCTAELMESSDLGPMYQRYLSKRGVACPDRWRMFRVPSAASSLLMNKGLSWKQLIDSGLFWLAPDGSLTAKGCLQSGRLIIPYWNGNELLGFKSRISPLDEADDDSMRYLTPTGMLIGRYVWNRDLKKGGDLHVTEGELKAIVGNEFGLNTGSISGLGSWQTSIPHLKKLMSEYGYRRLHIVLDSDPQYMESFPLLRAALGLRSAFPDRAQIVFLPQQHPDQKEALDTYLIRWGLEQYEWFIERQWNRRQQVVEELRRAIRTARAKHVEARLSKDSESEED